MKIKNLSTLLLIAGLLLIGKSSYMTVKAELAQLLINHTWYARQQNEQPAKPWPWADTRVIAMLEFPAQQVKRFVMHDANAESLAFGPGLVTVNSLPASSNHSIIAGHRDSHFEFLQEVKIGDQFLVTNFLGQHQSYRVVDIRVINSDKEQLIHSNDEDLISLITCYPFNDITSGPQRLVIDAQPVTIAMSI